MTDDDRISRLLLLASQDREAGKHTLAATRVEMARKIVLEPTKGTIR